MVLSYLGIVLIVMVVGCVLAGLMILATKLKDESRKDMVRQIRKEIDRSEFVQGYCDMQIELLDRGFEVMSKHGKQLMVDLNDFIEKKEEEQQKATEELMKKNNDLFEKSMKFGNDKSNKYDF